MPQIQCRVMSGCAEQSIEQSIKATKGGAGEKEFVPRLNVESLTTLVARIPPLRLMRSLPIWRSTEVRCKKESADLDLDKAFSVESKVSRADDEHLGSDESILPQAQ